MNAVYFDTTTGEILLLVQASTLASFEADMVSGMGFLIGNADDTADYVNLDAVPVIMAKSNYTLEALPLPCTVTIEGVEYEVTAQPEFTFNYPGTYKIKVNAGVRFLEKEFEIDYQP